MVSDGCIERAIVHLLDHKAYALSGTEPGFHRDHLVIYSPLDGKHFVAIRDRYTGTVVTILPMEFHATLAWKVEEKHFDEAKSKAQAAFGALVVPIPDEKPGLIPPSTIAVAGSYVDLKGAQKTKHLFRLSSATFNLFDQ